MQATNMKIVFIILIMSLFTSVNSADLSGGVDLGNIHYDEVSGAASVGDISAEENNLSVGNDISVTNEKSTVGNLVAEGAEYSPEGNNTTAVASEKQDIKVQSTTGVGNVEELPSTGPSEILLLLLSFLIAGSIFIKTRKTI